MEDEFENSVISMYNNNNWNDILQLPTDQLNEKNHSLLWVWPSENNLIFIKNTIQKFNLIGVTSIGCGSGLFEWLLQQCTGLEVCGIEIDQSWWSSKYAKHKFIPLNFTQMPPDENQLPANHALLFCYFNHGPAFRQYIRAYRGCLVFIIGPGEGRGTLTNPEPFNAEFGSSDWCLIDHQEVKNTKDFIAVYYRKIQSPSPVDR